MSKLRSIIRKVMRWKDVPNDNQLELFEEPKKTTVGALRDALHNGLMPQPALMYSAEDFKPRPRRVRDDVDIAPWLIKLETKAIHTATTNENCHLCGKPNGGGFYSYHGVSWPDGLLHWIISHNVELPAEFRNWILWMTKE